jgi:EAL domain-containing protein (putative c-di-GMP-specific phosphodiesterase class I)
VLEITEQSPVEDYDAVHEAVRSLGPDVRLAVDDAGAGFASLRHIIELRPQFVKLDMALVRGIDRDPARQALVAGMVYYAGATGCALIAEGVETEGERRTLRRLGVSFGQGYLLGKPGPAVPAPPRRMRRSRDVAQERVAQAV